MAPVDVLAVMEMHANGMRDASILGALTLKTSALANISVELSEARAAVADLIEALRIAVRQNSHDMLMTGEELRICESAIAKATGDRA